MIDGHGTLITAQDDEGADIPFLTKDEILKQLMKFGFYITYDVKNNLPEFVLDFLYKVMNLGYDKISRIALESYDVNGNRVWRPTVIVIKSGYNTDLLTFDCKVFRKKFDEKLECNTLMNVTHEPGMIWDWLAYIANIEDILDENHYPPEPEPQPDPEPEPEPDPEEGEDNGL